MTLMHCECHFGEVKLMFRCRHRNVHRSSWAHWQTRSGLPISVNWTFFLARCYGWGATGEYRL